MSQLRTQVINDLERQGIPTIDVKTKMGFGKVHID